MKTSSLSPSFVSMSVMAMAVTNKQGCEAPRGPDRADVDFCDPCDSGSISRQTGLHCTPSAGRQQRFGLKVPVSCPPATRFCTILSAKPLATLCAVAPNLPYDQCSSCCVWLTRLSLTFPRSLGSRPIALTPWQGALVLPPLSFKASACDVSA